MNFIIDEPVKSDLSLLTNSEYFDVCQKNLMESLAPLIPPVPGLVPVFQIMQDNFVQIDDLFKNSRAAIQTKEIEHLYHYSRALFVLFKQTVYASAISSNASDVAAAAALQPLVEVYKEVTSASYAQQSGLLSNFAADCSKPAYLAAATTLSLNAVATRILTANDSFGDLIEERGLEKEVSTAKGTLNDARKRMNGSIVILIASVNNTCMLNELGAKDPTLRANLQQIAVVINFAIHRIKQIVANRGHHKAKKDAKKDAGTQTPAPTTPPAPAPTTQPAPASTTPPAPASTTQPAPASTTPPQAPTTPPPQNPVAIPPGINPKDLKPPSAGK